MIEEIVGTISLAGSAAAMWRTIQLAIPVVSKALADREAAKLADAQRLADVERSREGAAADTRRRLDACEQSHRNRDERDERHRRETAVEFGRLRGQIFALAERPRAHVTKARTRKGRA
jgi:hypothetical protein